MSREKVTLGRLGEEMARLYYVAHGYEILTSRFRTREGELDLVCRRRGVVAFVEVKTRRGEGCGAPAEAVTRRKLGRMRRVAGRYLADTEVGGVARYRFDVVGVTLRTDEGGLRLDVLKGVI
jgi:putative endonuclease